MGRSNAECRFEDGSEVSNNARSRSAATHLELTCNAAHVKNQEMIEAKKLLQQVVCTKIKDTCLSTAGFDS